MIQAQHRLWADLIFQPYLKWLFKTAFSYNPTFGCAAGNSATFALVIAPESQYMVGRVLCLFTQQTNFPTDYLSNDVGRAANSVQILCEDRGLFD